MKIVSLFIITIAYELWNIKQYFSFRPNSLYVQTPELVGVIEIKEENNLEVYYTYNLFKKAWSNKEVFLNKHKGELKVDWLFNIVAVIPTTIPQEEWSNLDIEY